MNEADAQRRIDDAVDALNHPESGVSPPPPELLARALLGPGAAAQAARERRLGVLLREQRPPMPATDELRARIVQAVAFRPRRTRRPVLPIAAGLAAAATLLFAVLPWRGPQELAQVPAPFVVQQPIPALTAPDADLAGLLSSLGLAPSTQASDPLQEEMDALVMDASSTARFLLGCLPNSEF